MQQNTHIRLGEVLVDYGYISEKQLENAIIVQKESKKRLGEILLDSGVIREEQLLVALAKRLRLKVIDMKTVKVDYAIVDLVPRMVSAKHCMVAFGTENNKIQIAVNDPLDFYAIEDMKSFIQDQTEIVLCKKEELRQIISRAYAEIDTRKIAAKADESAGNIVKKNTSVELQVSSEDEDSPIVILINSIILKAYTEGTSDIHIEPFEEFVNIRFRVDGQLTSYRKLESELAGQIATRIKILSELDIAEKRAPQDGNFNVMIDGKEVGIRVSVIPTIYGEKLVLRFLSQTAKLDHAEHYGMNEENYKTMQHILQNPHGIIYITGPTGSGKTTTLYMMLQMMQDKPINISTIEDPVERHIPGITQVQVNPKAGITFESGLRSMLRQDPDVILVGETRDSETAQIAVSAAITGHLVFSTLHTNDAISSVVRLSDMGIKPYLIANSVVGIVAQRLIKKICPLCKREYELNEEEQEIMGGAKVLYKGEGCSDCNHTGYKGRIAVHEILEIDKDVRSMIANNLPTEEIYAKVREKGKMVFVKEQVYQLALDGITTIEEYNKHAAFEV